MHSVTHHWLGLSCCEFVVDAPLGPWLFRRLGRAAEMLRCESNADGAVSSYRSLGVYWRQPPPNQDQALAHISQVLHDCLNLDASLLGHEPREHIVTATYNGEDLADVAQHGGLSPAEVAERHSQAEYIVAAVGFMPHFAYLWGMDTTIATPRRSSPRPRVPIGAIGIAEGQTGIYPSQSPGGWQLIGQVDKALCQQICPQMKIGDVVRFVDSGETSLC